jgi:nucleotide-binding universal stress UspA family protein
MLLEAQRHDVVLLGKQTYFQFDTGTQPDDVADKIIEHSPRPVVVSPEQAENRLTSVIAYDSSLPAAKTLGSFVSSGLAEKRTLHLVSVDEQKEAAEHKMRRAVDYLQKHGLSVETHAIESEANVGEILLDQVAELNAGLLVMGVFGKPSLQSFFFGSTTKHILKNATVPVFIDH